MPTETSTHKTTEFGTECFNPGHPNNELEYTFSFILL